MIDFTKLDTDSLLDRITKHALFNKMVSRTKWGEKRFEEV